MIRPVIGHSDEFESKALFEEQFFLVCPADHRLAPRRSIRLRDLKDCEYIQLSPSGSLAKILDPLLAKVPMRESGLKLQYHASIAGLVASGFGVSVVPGFSTVYYDRPGIVRVPVVDANLRREFHLVMRKGDVPSRSMSALIDLIHCSRPSHTVPGWKPVVAARPSRIAPP